MKLSRRSPIQGIVNEYIIDSPSPINISYFWSFGSLQGQNQVIMIITGVALAMHYTPNTALAFNSIEHIMRDVNNGWIQRYIHANGASFFFVFVYLHIARGQYYGSYRSPRGQQWTQGVVIYIIMMATAFIGYVLPWGQMSLWGYSPNVIFSQSVSPIFTIRSIKRIGPHNKDVISFIYGSQLSDGYAERHGNGTRIVQQQESRNREFLNWYNNYLKERGYSTSKSANKIQSRIGINSKRRFYQKSTTWTYSSFNFIYDAFYPKSIKVVPSDLKTYLTPLTLAIWIMGDGAKVSVGCKQCTNSFTKKDCNKISQLFKEVFTIESSVISAGVPNQWNIYIGKKEMNKLREIVKPYIVPSMKYKIGC